MGFTDKYIIELGKATEALTSAVLCMILFAKYEEEYGSGTDTDFPASLAAAVTNVVLNYDPASQQGADFLQENDHLIQEKAKELSRDGELCALLSGAVYNMCYARFLALGGKRGLIINRFLGFVRALNNETKARSPRPAASTLQNCLEWLGEQQPAAVPLVNLSALGLFVPLSYNPNEKTYYEIVIRKGKELGLTK
jgi:hypothetical protein